MTSVVGELNVSSTGHVSFESGGWTSKVTVFPLCVGVTVDAGGIAPGRQTRAAAPSAVVTAPATPCDTTAGLGTAVGTGAAATAVGTTAVADAEPPRPVAVTTAATYAPISPALSWY